MRRLHAAVLAALTACAAAAIAGCGAGSTPVSPNPTIVQTQSGPVLGAISGSTRTFQGIPYAAAPLGNLRWAPPSPRPTFSPPYFDATKAPTVCPQGGPAQGVPYGLDQTTSEDCLNLNITEPYPAVNAPVMVWIHGGSFNQGSGAFYPGAAFAAQGVVFVSINYRLGLLGFLASSLWDTSGVQVANFGLEDQIAALQWVHKNIAAFGGNPANVTIAGESAGALSVCALVANAAAGGSPSAAGTFNRAIVESGPCQAPNTTLTSAESSESAYVTALEANCPSGQSGAACLRSLPLATIMNVQLSQLQNPTVFPAQGGPAFPTTTSSAIGAVPMMLGGNKYEWGLFVALYALSGLEPLPQNQTQYNAELSATSNYGSTVGPIVASSPQYSWTTFNPGGTWSALDTQWAQWGGQDLVAPTVTEADFMPADVLALCYDVVNWNKAAATTNPIYAYEFADPNAPTTLPYSPYNLAVPPGPLHAAELQYLFPGIASPPNVPPNNVSASAMLTGNEATLSQTMIAYWANFVKTGNPNASGLPAWSPYTTVNGTQAQQLNSGTNGVGPGVSVDAEHNCSTFWEPIYSSVPGLLD